MPVSWGLFQTPRLAGERRDGRGAWRGQWALPGDQVDVGAVAPRQLLQRPRPRRRGSGLPSPVLKLAWQRMQTYIFELDIRGLTPGSACGRAAVYSAWVWRSFMPFVDTALGADRRVAMSRSGCW